MPGFLGNLVDGGIKALKNPAMAAVESLKPKLKNPAQDAINALKPKLKNPAQEAVNALKLRTKGLPEKVAGAVSKGKDIRDRAESFIKDPGDAVSGVASKLGLPKLF